MSKTGSPTTTAHLRAIVPLPITTTSRWYQAFGFWWCLHPTSCGHTLLGLALSVVQPTTTTCSSIDVILRIPFHSQCRPLEQFQRSPCFPISYRCRRHVVLNPPQSTPTTVCFQPLMRPTIDHFVVVHLDINFAPLAPIRRERHRHPPPASLSVHCPLAPPCELSSREQDTIASKSTSVVWLHDNAEQAHTMAPSVIEPASPSHIHYKRSHCSHFISSKGAVASIIVPHPDGTGQPWRCMVSVRVLIQSSAVFRCMLKCRMKEGNSRCIHLNQWRAECVCAALSFLVQGGTVVDIVQLQHAAELYQFAHYFDMSTLLEAARNTICTNLTADTCIAYLRMAHTYSDETLTSAVKAFFSVNFGGVAGSRSSAAELNELPLSLMREIVQMDSLHSSELQVFFMCARWLFHHKEEGQHVEEGGTGSLLDDVRWKLMTAEMLDVVRVCVSGSWWCGQLMRAKALQKASTGTISHRRHHGRPTASMKAVVVAPPPSVAVAGGGRSLDWFGSKQRDGLRKCSAHSRRVYAINQRTFKYNKREWTMEVQLVRCERKGCQQVRLSVGLWLEEEDWERGAWGTWRNWWAAMYGGREEGLRVVARVMVQDGGGEWTESGDLDVVFRCSGKDHGWVLSDMMGGAERTERFLDLVVSSSSGSSLFGTGFITVNIEMRQCESVCLR